MGSSCHLVKDTKASKPPSSDYTAASTLRQSWASQSTIPAASQHSLWLVKHLTQYHSIPLQFTKLHQTLFIHELPKLLIYLLLLHYPKVYRPYSVYLLSCVLSVLHILFCVCIVLHSSHTFLCICTLCSLLCISPCSWNYILTFCSSVYQLLYVMTIKTHLTCVETVLPQAFHLCKRTTQVYWGLTKGY